MDIIELRLEKFKLYSPSTGELIYDSLEKHLNEDEKSLIGCWDLDSDDLSDYYGTHLVDDEVQFFLSGVTINHPEMFRKWEEYLVDRSHSRFDQGPDKVDVGNFILGYNQQPSWIAFRIEKLGMPEDVTWFVVDMK